MKPYFYIYRYQDKAPVIRHATLEQAQAEAERLATQHKGTPFEILKCVGISQVTGPAYTFFMEGEGSAKPLFEVLHKAAEHLESAHEMVPHQRKCPECGKSVDEFGDCYHRDDSVFPNA